MHVRVPHSLMTWLPGDSLRGWATSTLEVQTRTTMQQHSRTRPNHATLHCTGWVARLAQSSVLLCTKPEDLVTFPDMKAPACWMKCLVEVDQNQNDCWMCLK